MAIFGPEPKWRNVNLSTFWTSCFYSLERRVFFLEYRRRHFPALYCFQKKLEKRPFFDQNQNPDLLDFFKTLYFWSKKHSVLFRISKKDLFFLRRSSSGKCVWRYSRKEKSIFTIWKEDDKIVKNRDFSKGLVYNFGQKFEVALFLF